MGHVTRFAHQRQTDLDTSHRGRQLKNALSAKITYADRNQSQLLIFSSRCSSFRVDGEALLGVACMCFSPLSSYPLFFLCPCEILDMSKPIVEVNSDWPAMLRYDLCWSFKIRNLALITAFCDENEALILHDLSHYYLEIEVQQPAVIS